MAKKRTELDADEGAGYFDTNYQEARTPPQAADLEFDDSADSYRVGLRDSEWQRVDAIAAEMGITRNKVAAWALRSFLKQYEAGDIQTVKKPPHRCYKMLNSEIKLIFLKTYFKVFAQPEQS
jgi:hypothetical protein